MRIILSILVLLILTIAKASIYEVGDFVSEEHQDITKSTCYTGNEYDTGENWKLADWNGAINGGHHTVIFIDMSATW